jgi:FkbM family methyltransferase
MGGRTCGILEMDIDVMSAEPRSPEREAPGAPRRDRAGPDMASAVRYDLASRLKFDRATGVLSGATLRERVAASVFQAGARISSLWSYRGFNAGCKAMAPITPSGDVTVRLNDDALFSFPFGDGYWGLLLDTAYTYERDIERFFRGIADADYTLIDCGANYGYWSVLVTSGPYGAHNSIAIEPSSRNFAKLTNNAALNGDRFATLQRAIGASDGMARLSGRKHEALSIAGEQDGDGEDVPVMALDQLLARAVIRTDGRYVIKLDVEGVEIEAIKGGARLLQTDCVVICEEHGNDRNHTVSRYIRDNTPFKLFCFDPATGRFEHLDDLSALDHIKRATNFGYNVLATASSFWEQRIRDLNRGAGRA